MLLPDEMFLPEIWGLFAVGTLWVVLRFAVRFRTVGIEGLTIDDGFAFVAVVCWAIIVSGMHSTYFTKTNIDFEPDEVYYLTYKEIEAVRGGSKYYIITLYAYIIMIFSLKAIVILLYHRLVIGNWQKYLLRLTTVLCIVGSITTTLMFTLMCMPFSKRFEVKPLPEEKCRSSLTFFIVVSCFNASTDALLLAIPVPLLWTLRIPLHRRIGVFVLLSSGIFVMGACITRVSLTVIPNVTVRVIARWGARELSIALVAVNSAALRPVFRKSFWKSKDANAADDRHHRWHRNLYVFSAVKRIRKKFEKYGNLNSTSAGVSTIRRFMQSTAISTQRTLRPSDDTSSVPVPPRAFFSSRLGRRTNATNTQQSFIPRVLGFNSQMGEWGHTRSEIPPAMQENTWDRDVEEGENTNAMVTRI